MSDHNVESFTTEQLGELGKPLPQRLISERRGGGRSALQYIEGHVAIDQANRIFGYGNWSYKPLSVEQVVLLDPMTGEPVGIEYKALVQLYVRGTIAPIVDIGSHPVAPWNVEDHIRQRRLKVANGNGNGGKSDADVSDFTWLEKREARIAITDAHEISKKGAVTDGMKRCLRSYGPQFANDLYGDGSKSQAVVMASEEQTKRIAAFCKTLKRDQPVFIELTADEADKLLRELVLAYRVSKEADSTK